MTQERIRNRINDQASEIFVILDANQQRRDREPAPDDNVARIKEAIKLYREGRITQVSETSIFTELLGLTEASEGAIQQGLLRNLQKEPTDEEVNALIDDLASALENNFRDPETGVVIPPRIPGAMTIREYVAENLFNTTERGSSFSPLESNNPVIAILNQGIIDREREVQFLPTQLTTIDKYIATVQALDDFDLLPEAFADRLRGVPSGDISQEDLNEATAYARQLYSRIPEITEAIIQRELSSEGNPLSGVYEFELSRLIAGQSPEQLISGESFLPPLPPSQFERQRAQLLASEGDAPTQTRKEIEFQLNLLGQQTKGLPKEQQDILNAFMDDIEGKTNVMLAPHEERGLLQGERNRVIKSLVGSQLPDTLAELREQIQAGITPDDFTISDAQKAVRDAFVVIGEDDVDSDIINAAARDLFENRNIGMGVQISPEQAAAGHVPEIRERQRIEAIEQQTRAVERQGPTNLISDFLNRRGSPLPAIGTVSPNRAAQAAQRSVATNVLSALTPAVEVEIENARREVRVPDIDSVLGRILQSPESVGLNPTDIDIPTGRFGDAPFAPPAIPSISRDDLPPSEIGSRQRPVVGVATPPAVPEVNSAVRPAFQAGRVVEGQEIPTQQEASRLFREASGGDETFLSFLLGSGDVIGDFGRQRDAAIERETSFLQASRTGMQSNATRTVGPTLASLLRDPGLARRFRQSPEFLAERERQNQRALRGGRVRIIR